MMQKTSLGFDYLRRVSGDTGDRALIAFQGRLNWNEAAARVEPEIYNAYVKMKNSLADLWLGHSRAAFGLNAYLDSHALLLAPLGMTDFGFENDWGLGLLHDTDWGDVALSYTLGSGLPVKTDGGHLASGRISYGILNQNNFNLGFSRSNGVLAGSPEVDFIGLDASLYYENYEFRLENTIGTKGDRPYYSFLARAGVKFLDEDRIKIEVQQVNIVHGGQSEQSNALALAYIYDENLTLRLMGQTETMTNTSQIFGQIYYYAPW